MLDIYKTRLNLYCKRKCTEQKKHGRFIFVLLGILLAFSSESCNLNWRRNGITFLCVQFFLWFFFLVIIRVKNLAPAFAYVQLVMSEKEEEDEEKEVKTVHS